jgi:hypothetical protein
MTNALQTFRCLVALILIGAMAAPVAAFQHGRVQVQDRNGDGRPDVWRFSDGSSGTITVAADTDFDGRPDRQDTYRHGSLIRSEIDRNGDGAFDIVETFDPKTHEQVRSVIDVDFDGTADLLVLYRDGAPAFTSWRDPDAATAPAAGTGRLIDPFRTHAAVDSGTDVAQTRTDARIVSPALSVAPPQGSAVRLRTRVLLPSAPPPVFDARSFFSPRGPPARLLA